MTATTSYKPRRGFTLVELMVAMALIIFIMVILTEAFAAGTGVFRTLKSQGDLMERLRAVSNKLGNDLRQPHFDQNEKKLSNLFTSPDNVPTGGYFLVNQPQLSVAEGADGAGVNSLRMGLPVGVLPGQVTGAMLPSLCFTVRRNGIQPSNYFVGRVYGPQPNPSLPGQQTLVGVNAVLTPAEAQLLWQPPGPFFGQGPLDYQMPRNAPNLILPGPPPVTNPPPPQVTMSGTLIGLWTEVGWFLAPELDTNGQPITTATTGNIQVGPPQPLFSLRRRVRVLVPDDPPQPVPAPIPGAPSVTQLTTILNNAPNRVPVLFPVPPLGNQIINLWGARYAEVSCAPDTLGGQPGSLYFNTPADLMNPARQAMPLSLSPLGFGSTVANPTANGPQEWSGDDIVLSDVVSFNVRILAKDNTGLYKVLAPLNGGMLASNQGQSNWLGTGGPDFMDVAAANASYNPLTAPAGAPFPPPGTSLPYGAPLTYPTVALPAVPGTAYNTGSFRWPPTPTSSPPPYSIQALEITIRVWDVKMAQTRQITIVQDM
jgi:prepilin-type N-terminal cleavage/methylation domain-containing protein